jgi:hypothetical protein
MELPDPWTASTSDTERDEKKRVASPASFFFCQGRGICLAAEYFHDGRLITTAQGGTAKKHRLRIHLALFGQLMASFEYMLKDFIARVVDLSDVFDERLKRCSWVKIDLDRVLAIRMASMSAGSLLVHPTQRWHDADAVNHRYGELFHDSIIKAGEVEFLNHLWILRHSVAHNAGYVTGPDAARLGASPLANKIAHVDDTFIKDTFDFLRPIAERQAAVFGRRVLKEWMHHRVPDEDFARDKGRYTQFLHLATFVASRTQELPEATAADYSADFAASRAAP